MNKMNRYNPNNTIDHQFIMDKMIEVGDQASEYMTQHFLKYHNDEVFYKENCSEIVTEMDIYIEQMTIKSLKQNFPNAAFIGEENHQCGQIDRSKEFTFIIDPIDGTSNYVYGSSCFAFSLGFAYFGQLIGGLIFAPIAGEKFYAMQNCEAIYETNGQKFTFKEALNRQYHGQHKYLIGTTYPCINLIYDRLSKKVSVRILGSISLSICYALVGRLDGFVSNRSKLWDIAGAIGIAHAANIPFFSKYTAETENYSLILHYDRNEISHLKDLLDF